MNMLPPGYRRLVCEIMMLTYYDLKEKGNRGGRRFQYKQEALSFVKSEWFELLCMGINLEPEATKENLLSVYYRRKRKSS